MLNFLTMDALIWVDYVIIGIVSMSALIGLLRGLIKEAFALALWIFAGWVGFHFSRDFSMLFQNSISYPSARIGAAFVVLFVATLMLGGIISFILSKLIESTGLTGTDRLLGMGFGVVRGCFLVALLVMLAGLTPLPEDPWWKQARLIPPFQALAVWLRDHAPSTLTGYLNYR